VSKRSVYRCPHCDRRVKRAPYVALVDRATRREVRYHGGDCSGPGLARAEELGPDRVILRFAHPRSGCGDSRSQLECRGRCFAVGTAEPAA
jgi:hypothetical protein